MNEIEISGDFGTVIFESAGKSNYVSINTEASLSFFESISVRYADISANALGLYSFANVGRDGEARWASLDVPKHILSSRKSCMVWKDKGRIKMNVDRVQTCPVEHVNSLCPDAFYGGCLEKIFDVGNKVRDIMGTEEGRAIMMQLIDNIYLSLGNSYHELIEFGQHQIIDIADEEGFYAVDEEEWADYVDQQEACGGIITMVDWLKDVDGRENYNVEIYEDDIDGEEYTGDPVDLFRRLVKSAKGVFAQIIKAKNFKGKAPLILVTDGIFESYENTLLTKFGTIPDMYYYYLNGFNGDKTLMPGILKWGGFNIVRRDSWAHFDSLTGATTHRAILATPGVWGIAHDTKTIDEYSGLGLQITQKLDAPYRGKVFMDTTFKVGTTIVNPDFMSNASLIKLPVA